MARLKIEDIEKIGSSRDQLCISVFIPTHRFGYQVNDKQDQLVFKNELQAIRHELSAKGYQERDIMNLLEPAYRLLDDSTAWRYMEEGLAMFLSPSFFRWDKYPISFTPQHFITQNFIISPLAPVLTDRNSFYILNINRDKISLYKADEFDIIEEKLPEDLIPSDMEEVMQYYEFQKHFDGKPMTSFHGMVLTSHGQRQEIDKRDRYLQEYIGKICQGLDSYLNDNPLPLVLAGSDHIQGYFRKTSKYTHILAEGIAGNYTDLQPDELHQKGWEVAKKEATQPRRNDIKSYKAWAGTGRTSYDLQDIYVSALAGRIESICFVKDTNIWASVKKDDRLELHENQHENDIHVFNDIVWHTLHNQGNVIQVDSYEDLPEKEVPVHMTAVYRY